MPARARKPAAGVKGGGGKTTAAGRSRSRTASLAGAAGGGAGADEPAAPTPAPGTDAGEETAGAGGQLEGDLPGGPPPADTAGPGEDVGRVISEESTDRTEHTDRTAQGRRRVRVEQVVTNRRVTAYPDGREVIRASTQVTSTEESIPVPYQAPGSDHPAPVG